MATSVVNQTTSRNMPRSLLLGAVSGLVGGLIFGMMMGMMNMLPMVAMLIKSDSAVVGFLVHMGISAGIGASFGFMMTFIPLQGRVGTVVAGILYGAVWWILGALILMPLMLGMSEMVLKIGSTQWLSLMGHVIYGAVAGIAFIFLKQRA